MRFLPSSPEPIGHAAIDGSNQVVHVFVSRQLADKWAASSGHALEAVFRGVPAYSRAAQDVLTERWRQVAVEGFDQRHDDTHENGELAKAAACYASHAGAGEAIRATYGPGAAFSAWPWEASAWKPQDERQTCVIACALMLANIERIDRAAEREAAKRVRT